MTGLAVLLASVGAADLSPRWKHLVGVVVAVAGALALGVGWHTTWLALICIVVLVIWLDAAEQQRPAGIVVLGIAAVGLVLASTGDIIGEVPLQDWYDDLPVPGLADVPLDRAALAVGVLLFLGTAANVVVRQALGATGPQVLAEENTLRGGRLLGPLERWLVFAFALSGNLGALGALVAAKGILRFPEISRDQPDGMRAEYVLVGSFVSWALALLFVPLF